MKLKIVQRPAVQVVNSETGEPVEFVSRISIKDGNLIVESVKLELEVESIANICSQCLSHK